jgi:hypothetical protein
VLPTLPSQRGPHPNGLVEAGDWGGLGDKVGIRDLIRLRWANRADSPS